MDSKIQPYSLYQTFNANLPKTDLSIEQKTSLSKYTDALYDHQKIAFIRLIIEHARISGEKVDSVSPPYTSTLKHTDKIEFDMNLFPIPLKWILWKFFEMCGAA